MNKLGLNGLYKYIEDLGLTNDIPREEFQALLEGVMKELSDVKVGELKVGPDQAPTYLFEILFRKGITFKIDWKWVPEDILEGVKIFVPSLEHQVINKHFDSVNKLWNLVLEINGVSVSASVPEDNPYELVERLNPFVEAKIGKTFVEFDDGTDSYTFVLVPKKSI